MSAPTYLTTAELGERWRTSARAVRAEITRKRLPATFIAGQWLVNETDAHAYEQGRLNVPRTPKRTRRPQPRGRVS